MPLGISVRMGTQFWRIKMKDRYRTKLKNNSSSKSRRANRNGMWKDKVGKCALHEYIARRLSKPIKCPKCKKELPLELSSTNHTYTRKLEDWEWLCRRCHMESDGRLEKVKQQFLIMHKIKSKIRINYNKKHNIICPSCSSYNCIRIVIRCKSQQYRCKNCKKYFTKNESFK